MADRGSRTADGDAPWSSFWSESDDPEAQALGGALRRAELARRWREFFAAQALAPADRLLDIASGGAAIGAAALVEGAGPRLFCLDFSFAALARIRAASKSGRAASLIQADARRLPFRPCAFASVVSQFGIEYAGPEAFGEAARVLAPAGAFGAVSHRRGGPIDRECQANAALLGAFVGCGLVKAARAALRASYALRTIGKSPASDKKAEAALASAAAKARGALAAAPLSPAKALVGRVIDDVARLCERRMAFAQGDVLQWLEDIETRQAHYAARMRAMSAAALGEQDIEALRALMTSAGLAAFDAAPLTFAGDAEPAAWWIAARRAP